jgi:hypothetical protein
LFVVGDVDVAGSVDLHVICSDSGRVDGGDDTGSSIDAPNGLITVVGNIEVAGAIDGNGVGGFQGRSGGRISISRPGIPAGDSVDGVGLVCPLARHAKATPRASLRIPKSYTFVRQAAYCNFASTPSIF